MDARVAPPRILLGHPPDQFADFREDSATRRSLLGVSPFACDELPVPAEQRVRRDDRSDLAQHLPAQPVGSRRKFPPVVIGEPRSPSAQLPPQDPILVDQVRQSPPAPGGPASW